jgi:hypothetical protein
MRILTRRDTGLLTQWTFGRSKFQDETIAFVNATGISDATTINAINALIVALKGYGIWTKIFALYPFVGGTAATHKFNLINPADTNLALRLSFVGGWTHSSNGALPNGTNAYANTFLSPATALSLNSSHFSYYSRTNSNLTEVEMGDNANLLMEIRTAGISYFRVNSNTLISFADTDSRAFYLLNRSASNLSNVWKNGISQVSSANASTALSPANIFLAAQNSAGVPSLFSNKQCALASIGGGLSLTEAANFYTAVQSFQTSIGRQI